MVCLGNICRSPLAEGILQSKLDKTKFLVDSAGTSDWHSGKQPDKRSIAIAKRFGVDISAQRARQFKIEDFEVFHYIYVMDNSNYKDILALAPNNKVKEKVRIIMNEIFEGENVDVPDPYYGLEGGFENVYIMLDKACSIIRKKLET